MKEDVAGDVHRKLYGMSDKINAPENQNREFQEGYGVGASSMAYSAELVLKEEFKLRIEVSDDLCDGFDEWKRGFWAARRQSFSSFPVACAASAISFSERHQINENRRLY